MEIKFTNQNSHLNLNEIYSYGIEVIAGRFHAKIWPTADMLYGSVNLTWSVFDNLKKYHIKQVHHIAYLEIAKSIDPCELARNKYMDALDSSILAIFLLTAEVLIETYNCRF